jgi:hypothetical protein
VKRAGVVGLIAVAIAIVIWTARDGDDPPRSTVKHRDQQTALAPRRTPVRDADPNAASADDVLRPDGRVIAPDGQAVGGATNEAHMLLSTHIHADGSEAEILWTEFLLEPTPSRTATTEADGRFRFALLERKLIRCSPRRAIWLAARSGPWSRSACTRRVHLLLAVVPKPAPKGGPHKVPRRSGLEFVCNLSAPPLAARCLGEAASIGAPETARSLALRPQCQSSGCRTACLPICPISDNRFWIPAQGARSGSGECRQRPPSGRRRRCPRRAPRSAREIIGLPGDGHRADDVPSRSTLERMGKRIGDAIQGIVTEVEPAIRHTEPTLHAGRSISIGFDRTTVPMAELASTPTRRSRPYVRRAPPAVTVAYRMAYVGTVSLHDDEGTVLVTKRFAATPLQGPDDIVDRVANEVRHLRTRYGALPMTVVQDGAP